MLASRHQPLLLHYSSSNTLNNDDAPSRTSSRPSFFDNTSHTAATPSPSHFNAQLSQSYFPPSPEYMSSNFDFSGPAIRVQHSTPAPHLPFEYPQQSAFVEGGQNSNWLFGGSGASDMITGSSLQTPALNKRSRPHQRAPSASSVGSSSPASPFSQGHATQLMYNTASPAIPKVDSYHADEATRTHSNHLPTPSQTPTQDSFLASSQPSSYATFQNFDSTMAAHMTLKHAVGDGNSVTEEDAPGFSHSTRQSVSSFGRNSPATPRTISGEDFNDDGFKLPTNDTVVRPNIQVPKFERTLTDVYSDELFNPTSMPPVQPPQKSAKNASLLSPYHNAMMNERLFQANQARSQSPTTNGSRAVSPFRQGSPYAQTRNNFGSPTTRLGASVPARQPRNGATDANVLAHQNAASDPSNEPKTISPKDALLDYHESDEDSKVPLFSDSDASQFGSYSGSTFQTSTSPSDNTYGSLAVSGGWANPTGQNSATSYSATSATAPAQSQFAFAPSSVPGAFHRLPSSTYSNNPMAASEETPEFPAHLTSMESSASEAPPQSSNNSNGADTSQKPSSTLADTGTYTCTYHGCTQRFETPQKLQRHKREAHRQNVPQQQQQQTTSQHPITPGVGSGMTSAALLARNSQAGPHKCERINPTTGKPCNTIFSRPYDLTRHEDTIHNVRKQKVRCALCQEEKTFSRNDALTRHMRVVHPDVDFPGKHRRRGRGDD